MKKVFSLVLALAMCLSAAGLAEGAAYTPGTYSASSAGFHSDVTVTVTVDESSITDVTLDVSGETEGIGAAAGDKLAAQILEAQGAQIDGVSGATVTSNAARVALTECLAAASGAAGEKAPVADGTYTGTAPSFGFLCQMACDVTFEDGAIKSIEVVEESDSATGEWFANAEELLIPRNGWNLMKIALTPSVVGNYPVSPF